MHGHPDDPLDVMASWNERHAAGVRASAAKTAARRLPGPVMADVKRQNRERHPCKVKGCTRTAYKGSICKTHWDTIPQRSKLELTMAVFDAQLKTADRFHRRFLRELNASGRASTAARGHATV